MNLYIEVGVPLPTDILSLDEARQAGYTAKMGARPRTRNTTKKSDANAAKRSKPLGSLVRHQPLKRVGKTDHLLVADHGSRRPDRVWCVGRPKADEVWEVPAEYPINIFIDCGVNKDPQVTYAPSARTCRP